MQNSTKKILGQYYTTNYEYILQNIKIPSYVRYIIEPFAGNGDLVNFIRNANETLEYNIECYDIEPKKDFILQRDTLSYPPQYSQKYVITNPPYLARNKSNQYKKLYDKYGVNDLYKCFIKEILTNICIGGILIIPLNFWSSIRKSDISLRKEFLKIYNVILLNIFEEQVFEDTTYTICSFQFEYKENNQTNKLNIMIYPSKQNIETELNEKNNYIVGGEIYNLPVKNTYKISRLTKKNLDKLSTNILVKCIDDNETKKIGLQWIDNEKYIDNTPNQTARTYATLIIEPEISILQQQELIENFNTYFNEYRQRFNSLFLTNYRESKHNICRKRVSFDLIYSLVEYILEYPNCF